MIYENKELILYVDDEHENLQAFKMVFGNTFQIFQSSNGKEALEIVQSYNIKVVICDQRMPDISGLELCKAINKINSAISCILMTAFSDIEVTMQAINQGGIKAYILKPWNKNDVQHKIDNALESYYLKDNNKQLIEQLKEKNIELDQAWKQARESDKLKSAFISNLSHEIKSPINSIVGFTEILQHNNHLSAKDKGFINIIAAAGLQLQNIINDILDISRIESGIIFIKPEPTNINLLLNEIYLMHHPMVLKKGLELQLSNEPLDNNYLMVDKIKLTQVLNNLINNALKFTSEGHINFGFHLLPPKQDMIEFFVSDTGIGIDKSNFETIFERFRQVDAGGYTFNQGNGLGLSIVKSYVELMGGSIRINSEIKKGSTFYFTLPAEWSVLPEPDLVTVNYPSASLRNVTILIVEDEVANYLFVKEILIDECKNILHASSGHEAIKLMNENKVDLVLMDIKMPGMNGFEAAAKIKKLAPDLPIIAQTAFGDITDINFDEIRDFEDYIFKPFTMQQLMVVIKQVLGGKKHRLNAKPQ